MAASRWKRLGPKTRPHFQRLTPWAMDDAAWSRCPLEAERLEAERLEAERLDGTGCSTKPAGA